MTEYVYGFKWARQADSRLLSGLTPRSSCVHEESCVEWNDSALCFFWFCGVRTSKSALSSHLGTKSQHCHSTHSTTSSQQHTSSWKQLLTSSTSQFVLLVKSTTRAQTAITEAGPIVLQLTFHSGLEHISFVHLTSRKRREIEDVLPSLTRDH